MGDAGLESVIFCTKHQNYPMSVVDTLQSSTKTNGRTLDSGMAGGQVLEPLVDFTSVIHADASFEKRPSQNGFTPTLPGADKVHPVVYVFIVAMAGMWSKMIRWEESADFWEDPHTYNM